MNFNAILGFWASTAAVFCALLFIRTVYVFVVTPTIHPSAFAFKCTSPVSVLLPVRNEAGRVLSQNIESLMDQSYKQLQILAVDDRSSDASLLILRKNEQLPESRLLVIQGEDVPSDWLGKVFALHQAKLHATGEWLLALDADVVYSPHAVESAMMFAQNNHLDALSLLPSVKMESFWESLIIPAMSWLSLMRVSPTQANRKRSKACFGYGNFILFKKTAHDSIGGFMSYKMDILDDCTPMERFKKAGFKVMVADGSHLMTSRMYTKLREIIEGFGKNTFAALRFSFLRVTGVILMEIFCVLLPPIYLLNKTLIDRGMSMTLPTILAGIAVLFFFLTMLSVGIKMRANIKFYLLYLLGHMFAVIIIIYSMARHKTNRGNLWKDRLVNTEMNA